MNPTIFNAFSSGDSNRHPTKSLASSLSPMQARLLETDFGWSLELSPMRAFDALRIWTHLAREIKADSGDETVAMLFDASPAQPEPISREQGKIAGESLGSTADRLEIATIDRFDDGDQVVLDDLSQRELVGMIQCTRLRSVLVAGPIEQRDAQAMMQAIEAGYSPLQAEFRAVASIEIVRDRLARLHTRTREHAELLVAENFRHYLAALRGRPAMEFSVPQPYQIKRLMDITGSLTIRPIETDVFSTSIDVGICTSTDGGSVPADRSLVYDVPSNTWHDEP